MTSSSDHYILSEFYVHLGYSSFERTSSLETIVPKNSVIERLNSILLQAFVGEKSFAEAYHHVKESRLANCNMLYRGKLHDLFQRLDFFLYSYLKY
jgi:hypothetical protein